MLTVEEAYRAVQDRVAPLPTVRLPLSMARGAILAEDVAADRDSPPFHKSVVDGYAVRTTDLTAPASALRIGESIFAGTVPTHPLGPREAALIMTGAPTPEGADAVVMIEHTRHEGSYVIVEPHGLQPGRNIMPRGSEMEAGQVVCRAGERLTPARLGVLASVGCPSPLVVPSARVAIVPTGDELVEAHRVPGPGQIRNSNAVVLESLVANAGAVPLLSAIAADNEGALSETLHEALASDVVLITGGVSAGQRDLVPAVLAKLGVEQVFHKVRLKPGKPLWFGIGPDRGNRPGALVFGLPGNPVSGIVGYLLFVRPALEALAGRTGQPFELPRHPLAQPFVHRGERTTFHPARKVCSDSDEESQIRLEPLSWSGSADLLTIAHADGFAHFPAGDREYAAGDVVGFLHLG